MTRLVLRGAWVAVFLVACGGSTDDGLTGGSGTGGASTGGANTGGASTGGASTGGASTGGASGGGGMGTGGMGTGGMGTGGMGTGGMGTGGMGTGGMGTGGMGTGGMGTGGMGTGGGTSTSCADLAAKYAAAVNAAKTCNPMLSVIQCDKKVPDKIVCACPTFVNHNNQAAITELTKLQEQWNQLGCGKNVACPEIACIEPPGAFCSPSGPGPGGKCSDAGGI